MAPIRLSTTGNSPAEFLHELQSGHKVELDNYTFLPDGDRVWVINDFGIDCNVLQLTPEGIACVFDSLSKGIHYGPRAECTGEAPRLTANPIV